MPYILEYLRVKQLVTQPRIDALNVTVLPL